MEPLETRLEPADPPALHVAGELDLATAAELSEAVQDASGPERPRLVLDLGDVTLLDSSGLRAVIHAARDARAKGTELLVRSPSGSEAALVIRLTGTAGLLGLRED